MSARRRSGKAVSGERSMETDLRSRISLAPGAEAVGLAVMIADLIRQNLERAPRKHADFQKLSASVSMEVPDADVTIMLEFSRGALLIHGGQHDGAHLHIRADSTTLLALPLVRISAGLPNLFSPDSSALRNGLLSGGVRIGGMLRHPLRLVRFTRLISVNG